MLITLDLINDNVADSEPHGSNVALFSRWGQKVKDVLCFSLLPNYYSIKKKKKKKLAKDQDKIVLLMFLPCKILKKSTFSRLKGTSYRCEQDSLIWVLIFSCYLRVSFFFF